MLGTQASSPARFGAELVLGCDSERLGDVVKRRLFLVAYLLTAEAEEASFAGRFGDLAADGAQPGLERGGIFRGLDVKKR